MLNLYNKLFWTKLIYKIMFRLFLCFKKLCYFSDVKFIKLLRSFCNFYISLLCFCFCICAKQDFLFIPDYKDVLHNLPIFVTRNYSGFITWFCYFKYNYTQLKYFYKKINTFFIKINKIYYQCFKFYKFNLFDKYYDFWLYRIGKLGNKLYNFEIKGFPWNKYPFFNSKNNNFYYSNFSRNFFSRLYVLFSCQFFKETLNKLEYRFLKYLYLIFISFFYDYFIYSMFFDPSIKYSMLYFVDNISLKYTNKFFKYLLMLFQHFSLIFNNNKYDTIVKMIYKSHFFN